MKELVPRPYQGLVIDHILRNPRCAVYAGMGTGKQQPNSEPVLTPLGWKPIGELEVGDCVIGADGSPTKVLGVYPQGEHETLRLTFSDGAYCHAGWDHLWSVNTAGRRHRGFPGSQKQRANL